MKKPLSQRAYLKKFAHCPNCGSEDISGESIDVDGNGASQECGCQNCGASWTDTYKLTGYVNLVVPSAKDRFPKSDWKYEVQNGDTKLGYQEWLAHRVESEENRRRTAR